MRSITRLPFRSVAPLGSVATCALLLGAVAAGCGSSSSSGPVANADAGPPPDRHVVVLFTSDEHSHFFSFSPELDDYPTATVAGTGPLLGGVARRATLIAQLRQTATAAGKDSILVSSGDNQMGTLTQLGFQSTSIDYGTMSTIGYDVSTLGNHEFDFGPAALATSITTATTAKAVPPLVASNIKFSATDTGDDTLAALYGTGLGDHAIEPYRIITTKAGVKIGVLGFVGINAAHVAPNKTPVTFSSVAGATDGDLPSNLPALYADIQPIVDTLRNTENVDLVVALSHAGISDENDATGIAAGEDTGICQNVNGIDLIVSGHAHQHGATPYPTPNTATGRACLILNGGAFGEEVGTVDFTIPGDPTKAISWDTTTQAMVPVNEGVIPDPTLAKQEDSVIAQVEATVAPGPSLAVFLSHALSQTVTDDTTKLGDLYFMKLGATTYDLTAAHPRVWLSADAMLEEADALVTEIGLLPTTLAVEAAGVIRAVLAQGKTGVISATDAFNVVPLGASPVDGSMGYPLVRGYISMTDLRAVIELGLAQGPLNSDYDLGLAGVKFEYDATRPLLTSSNDLLDATKGQVTMIAIDTDHSDGYEQYDKVVYVNGSTPQLDLSLVSVISSSYIAQFAGSEGVTLTDSASKPLTIANAILKRADSSEVKQVESFMRAIHLAPGGTLPATYNINSPGYTTREVCTKGC